MLRILAILLLAIGGLARIGTGATSAQHEDCGRALCAAPAVETSCCGDPAPADDFCPMSGGACMCAVSPVSERQPAPHAPLPRSDRDSLTAAPLLSIDVPRFVDCEVEPAGGPAASVSLLAGFTHNEIQALLGVWRA